MATIRAVVNFRVKAGKEADLLEAAKTVKKHVERLGGTFFIVRQFAGPESGNIVAVSQYSDWSQFAKAAGDREWAQFLDNVRRDTNPPWESLTVSISEEITL